MRSRSAIVLSALLSSAGGALAEDPLLIVAPGFKPISYEEGGAAGGLGTDIVAEAFRRAGRSVRFEILPGTRAIAMIKAGTADALFAVAKTPEREAFASYPSEPIIDQPISLFVSAGSRIAYSGDIGTLAGYRIAIVRGGRFSPEFEKAIRNERFADIEEVTEYEQTIRMLDTGRVDIVIGARISVLYAARELGRAGTIRELSPPVSPSSPAYLAFSKTGRAAGLAPLFDAAMRSMIEDGTYDRILRKYLR
jgi:polar amino acid transport system substrate-binding protein